MELFQPVYIFFERLFAAESPFKLDESKMPDKSIRS
jgi:hypothetical protein